jgi:hypothetical protein
MPTITDPQSPSAGASRAFELYDAKMPVRRYKLLLQTFLKRRGSGTRQAMADALGLTRGFVTQMTSPAYDLAIPETHVRSLVRLAGLEPAEERAFLDAYVAAHPDRAAEMLGSGTAHAQRTLTITLPALASEAAQCRLEALVERFAKDVAAAMLASEGEARKTGT